MNTEQSYKPYCICKVCVNRTFDICPTKYKLLIDNLEKEIENKQKELKNMKIAYQVMNNVQYEYS